MLAADPMIIDFHTHMYPEKIRERAMAAIPPPYHAAIDGSRAGLLRSMEENGIDYAVNLPLVNTPRNARGVLAWAQMENHGPIRMLGSLHPEDPAWRESLEWICRQGMPGVKLHPDYQNFIIDEARMDVIYDTLAQLEI
ncbi:MAG: amidohydrolase, partial [Lentisphaeria bacterium]|nr:amidohydrolase [Lentisphaeria bacterium]